jgi:hypothetical protein
MQELRAGWDKEKAEHDRQVKEQTDALRKQRQREKEDFDYEFAREKEQRKNAIEDELSSLEKEIQQRRKDFEQELSQRRAELEAREGAVAKRETEMAALQKEVETFPQRTEDKVRVAVKDVTERLTGDFSKSEALLTAKFEGEKNVLSSKIEALEKLVKALETQNEELARRNEQAYEKVQDIANRAVAASKREYIPIPTPFHDKPGQGQSEK